MSRRLVWSGVALGTLAGLATACGGEAGDGAIDAAAVDVADQPLTLTSDELAPGAMIAVANACDGANVSPAFRWTGGPAAPASYAVVLTDKSNDLVHWVIYDVAGTSLPHDIDKLEAPLDVAGAHQTLAYDDSTRGYLGPCPPNQHTYEFAVYALDVASLGATTATSSDAAVALIQAHDLASATLTGTYDRP